MANNLKKIMRFYDITGQNLSDKTGISRATISGIINDAGSNTTKSTMEKIAKAIGHGLSAEDIFFAQDVILVVQHKQRELQSN